MLKGVETILRRGSSSEMTNAFAVATNLGGDFRNEVALIAGYCTAAFLGYIRPHSQGWYFLSEKGEKRKTQIDGAGKVSEVTPVGTSQ